MTPPQHAACVSLSTPRRPGGIDAQATGPQRDLARQGLRGALCALALALGAGYAQATETPAANSASSASTSTLATPAGLSSAAETAGAASANASSLPPASNGAPLNANPVNANTPSAMQNSGPNTGRVVRFGNIGVFRNLIPSPALEAQAAAEYNEIVRGAAHSKLLYPDSDPHVMRVRQFVDRLAPYALKWSDRVKNWKWEVAVIRSPDIRMYCLPGGKIVVYGGLLDRVKLNDNELGMLLGHEIAHAVREHVRERLGEQQGAQIESGVVPQLFGLADLGVFPLGIGSRLVEMHYGRADETEADVIGSDIAARAGFDPRAALTLWDKLAVATKSDRDQGFIYVHPYTPARRADIAKRLADMMPLYAKAVGKPLNALPDYQGIAAVQRRKMVAAP
ncbi:Zn-dependent protease with chaperone function [Paraburkholderia bannensis]|uniref:Zn-dependent protease with chaperone function n=1 Tax=Paraburkholderia bannensis TaxID=765414 RepID=A0A7W9WPF5_9BURK|nr:MULTISPECIES: M48 family metallopeptidase [Paraburkholderia]MBB3256040.1 Zn-dependent protease with chaperone function [Paraburkholderia sp. WP4_3_2]MBB6101040.1 Zn-dependent protease with chaperone function [Paraburkholderia bannensis]